MEGEIRVEEVEGGIEAFEVVCKIWALAVAGGNGALVVKGGIDFLLTLSSNLCQHILHL